MWKTRLFILCILVGLVGCDPGTEEGQETFGESIMDHETDWDTKCAALVGIHGEPLLMEKNHTMDLLAGKMELSAVEWVQNLPQEEDDQKTDICDCTGMCNACMDAYICGHEAAILEYCDDCAQCQKECNPDSDD